MKKGSFVVIEGPDGTGKETQAKLLMSRFQEQRIPVEFFDLPQYETSFFGNLVGRFLLITIA
ncbi:MAG: thymidylate kinase [Microgenomates group bacterium GW2011_GWC1_39_7b]|nr:MAG: thymidylate kinase [Microgenomates group bacterium GW2011_GWC1_39_7b]